MKLLYKMTIKLRNWIYSFIFVLGISVDSSTGSRVNKTEWDKIWSEWENPRVDELKTGYFPRIRSNKSLEFEMDKLLWKKEEAHEYPIKNKNHL